MIDHHFGEQELDPLCGAQVDRDSAEGAGLTGRYNDDRYVFCGVSCQIEFQADPRAALGLDDGWMPRRARLSFRSTSEVN